MKAGDLVVLIPSSTTDPGWIGMLAEVAELDESSATFPGLVRLEPLWPRPDENGMYPFHWPISEVRVLNKEQLLRVATWMARKGVVGG